MFSARRVLEPHSVQGARAGDTRPRAQRREAHTIPDPKARRRPDLVRRDFNSPVPTYKLVGDITVSALASAKSRGYVTGNAIFHADHGAQHTSRLLAEWARANDVRLSCSHTDSCQDNAVAESFFATLKNEMYHRRSFPTRNSAKHAAIEFIEACYNRRRPHSTIGCKVPAEAMEEFFERTAPKPEELPMAA